MKSHLSIQLIIVSVFFFILYDLDSDNEMKDILLRLCKASLWAEWKWQQ